MTQPANTTYNSFPLEWKPSQYSKAIRTITNQLARQKGQFYIKSVADRLAELNDPGNTSWANVVKQYRKTNTVFDLNERPKFAWVEILKILIDEDIQREMDVKHIVDISMQNNFDPKRLAPIFAVKLDGEDEYHCTDGQHTLVVTAALAQAGLWEGVDRNDWGKVLVPVFYVEGEDRSFAREYFAYINGKGKKRIDAYDTHKQEVLSNRLDGNNSPEYAKANELQTICENATVFPLREKDPDSGLAGALTHVSGMRKQDPETLKFIMHCHRKYWSGEVFDSSEFGFYGNMFETAIADGIDVNSIEFEEFMDQVNAVVKEFFLIPAGLRETAIDAFKQYANKVYKNYKATADDTVALAIVLKIYEKLGGTHQVPSTVFLHSQGKYDIIDFLPESIKKAIADLTA